MGLLQLKADRRVMFCVCALLAAIVPGCKRASVVSSGLYTCVGHDDCAWGWHCEHGDASVGHCLTGFAVLDAGPACEGFPPACTLQDGVCQGATEVCGPDGRWVACGEGDYLAYSRSHGLTYEPDERSCDQQDNDCDGVVDEASAACCQPDCTDKTCGADDGCGTPCISDSCGANERCELGGCVCLWQRCGASCCARDNVCHEDGCCAPSCGTRVCGPDPTCGISCGRCTKDQLCDLDGRCSGTAWATAYGNGSDTSALDIATDDRLHSYVGGTFSGSMTFGEAQHVAVGLGDGYAIETGPTGELLWSTVVSGPGYDDVAGVAVAPNGDILLGGTFTGDLKLLGVTRGTSRGDSDGYVAKLSRSHELLWVNQIGGAGRDRVDALAVDSSGSVLVIGRYSGELTVGQEQLSTVGESGLLIATLDATTGAVVHARGVSGDGAIQGHAIMPDRANNIYVAGSFSGQALFGSVAVSSVAGSTDAFLAKLDSAANPLWVAHAGDTGVDGFYNLAVAANGQATVAGSFQSEVQLTPELAVASRGDHDLWVARYGPSSELLWVATAGGAGADLAGGVTLDPNGGVYVAGSYGGDAAFGGQTLVLSDYADLFIAHLSPAGGVTYAVSATGKDLLSASKITLDAAGNLRLIGRMQGQADLDGLALVPDLALGEVAFFVWSFSPDERW